MRRILSAVLLLSPLFFTVAAVASTSATDATSTPVRPVSTGVIPAQVIYSPTVKLDSSLEVPNNAEVVLKLNVGTDGQAHDIQVVSSINPLLDAPVVDAVSKARFRPAMLDHQTISLPVNLTVLVQQ